MPRTPGDPRTLRADADTPITVVRAGTVPYLTAWDWQRDLAARRHAGEIGDVLLLLEHPRVSTKVTPSSEGGVEQAMLQGGVNLEHRGDPAFDTADFAEPPGNIRVDYVLPSKHLKIEDAGVFWPTSDDPLFRLVGTYPFPTSDHRLVWADLRLVHRD